MPSAAVPVTGPVVVTLTVPVPALVASIPVVPETVPPLTAKAPLPAALVWRATIAVACGLED